MNCPTNDSASAPAPAPAAALIYVVDDEMVLLEMATVVLKAAGYDVRTFPSAEAALGALTDAEQRPELIITDYAMLQMTGLELIAACWRVKPQPKTILVSGTEAEEVCFGALRKPDRFLSKPYRAKELIDAVQAVLASSGA